MWAGVGERASARVRVRGRAGVCACVQARVHGLNLPTLIYINPLPHECLEARVIRVLAWITCARVCACVCACMYVCVSVYVYTRQNSFNKALTLAVSFSPYVYSS